MLARRYGLYVILAGLATVATALGLLVSIAGYTLLLLLLAFNGLLVILAGVWMWTLDRSTP